ncbi:hypothetical protein MCEMRE196_01053 [Candidatus Nanopelagicaceae bacterium]
MKKLAIALLILSLARVGVAYADTETASDNSFSTGTTLATANANQILYFYRGADGAPGAPGADGQDGAPGADGLDGANGTNVSAVAFTGEKGGCTTGGVQISSVDSVTYICNGSSGTGVVPVAFTGTRGDCKAGGVEFVGSSGTTTRVCNGTNGLNGSDGTNGTNGTNGSTIVSISDTSTTSLTDGQVVARACDTDGSVKVDIDREFDGTDFVFTAFSFGDNNATTNGDLDAACANKPLSIYIAIDSTLTLSGTRDYQRRDIIKCSVNINAIANTNPQFTMSTGNICYVSTRSSVTASELTAASLTPPAASSSNTFTLRKISTADFVGSIGFTIGR